MDILLHREKVSVKHMAPHYEEYRQKINNMKIRRPEIVEVKKPTIEKLERHSFFCEDAESKQQLIVDFLSGKHDGLIVDIVQSKHPHFHEYFQHIEKTQHK